MKKFNKAAGKRLLEVSRSNDLVALQAALADGADVNMVGPNNYTAVMFAAAIGRSASLDILIKAGGDVNAENLLGVRPLVFAAYHGHTDCLVALVKAGADIECLRDHEEYDAYRAAKSIIEANELRKPNTIRIDASDVGLGL